MLNRKLWLDAFRNVNSNGATEKIRMAAAVCMEIDSGTIVETLMTLLQDNRSPTSRVHFEQLASVILAGQSMRAVR